MLDPVGSIDKFYENKKERKINEKLQQKNTDFIVKLEKEYIAKLKEKDEKIRKLKHKLKKYKRCIKEKQKEEEHIDEK